MSLQNIPEGIAEDILSYLSPETRDEVKNLFRLSSERPDIDPRYRLLLKYRNTLNNPKPLDINRFYDQLSYHKRLDREHYHKRFESGRSIDSFEYDTPKVQFMLASERGFDELVKILLLDPKLDPTIERNKADKDAVILGDAKILKILLEDPRVKTSVSVDFDILLREAGLSNYDEALKLLLSYSETKLEDLKIPFFAAIEGGNPHNVRLLLKSGKFDPSDFSDRAFTYAQSQARFEIRGHKHKQIITLLKDDDRFPS